MPPRYRIISVKRSDRLNHDRRLRRIAGVNPDGARWNISVDSAIAGIEARRWHFFVTLAARDVDVVVATSRYGNKYLKTADDNGPHPEGLLLLPECR
ncbi:MAG: DUF3892 domain-containing protein [Alphaproteobacteria bacterium]|nr:DUF3892 domain-containing protein [Alphaproteobacteria bacterium]